MIASGSVVAVLHDFTPPQLLRLLWRAPEQARLQEAMAGLLSFAESPEEVAARVLEPAAAIIGARAIANRNGEGRSVAAWNVPADTCARHERGTVPLSPAHAGDAAAVNAACSSFR